MPPSIYTYSETLEVSDFPEGRNWKNVIVTSK